jgi:uncharacterized phosphatase
MIVAFIRHGQTDWNREGLLQGSSDIPLNDMGRQQAHDAFMTLRSRPWDAVVSSPLQRARETARIIAEGLDIPLGPAYGQLIERDYGPLEGTSAAAAIERWPDREYPDAEALDAVAGRPVPGIDNGSISLLRLENDHWEVATVNGIPLDEIPVEHAARQPSREGEDAATAP